MASRCAELHEERPTDQAELHSFIPQSLTWDIRINGAQAALLAGGRAVTDRSTSGHQHAGLAAEWRRVEPEAVCMHHLHTGGYAVPRSQCTHHQPSGTEFANALADILPTFRTFTFLTFCLLLSLTFCLSQPLICSMLKSLTF